MQMITRPAFWMELIKEKQEWLVMKHTTKATENQVQTIFCMATKEKQLILDEGFKGIKGIRDSFAKKNMWGKKKREHLPCVSLLKSKKNQRRKINGVLESL